MANNLPKLFFSFVLGASAITPALCVPAHPTMKAPAVVYREASSAQLKSMNHRLETETVGSAALTVNLDYIDNDYTPKNIYIYNEDVFEGGYISKYDPELRCVVFEGLPDGVYTIMASFDEKTSHFGTDWTMCFVFKEDVKVEGLTEITVDPTTATNQFIGKSLLPNGEIAEVDIYQYDENFDYEFIPGNCSDKLIQTTIYDTRYDAWIVSAIGNTGTYAMENYFGPGIHWKPEEQYNIMVNDISDNLVIVQQRDNYTDDGMVATVAYSKGLSNFDLSNNPENYQKVSESFDHTPAFDNYGATGEIYQLTGLGYKGWSYFPYSMIPWRMSSPSTLYYSTSDNADDFEDFHSYYRFELYDAMADWNQFYVKGQRLTFDDQGGVYVFSNFFTPSEYSGTRAVNEEGDEIYYEFPGNSGLNVRPSEMTPYVYGNSMAYNTISPVIYHNDNGYYTNFNPNYKGLLGEDREADKIALKTQVYHNGEELSVAPEDWNSFWHQAPSNDNTGVYTAKFVNDENIKVGDMQGYNITELSFSYDNEDICPPSLQAIQFRNNDNVFTHEFSDKSDVNVIIAGGDYDWWETEDYLEYNYTSKPVSLELEIARHGEETKSWSKIETSIIEEYNNIAGYGYYFKGNLNEVELPSSDSWYDLRISLTDEAGNTNIQEIGPAFKICSSTTDIYEIAANETSIKYLDGKLISIDGTVGNFTVTDVTGKIVKKFSGKSVDLSDLSAGIYFAVFETSETISNLKFIK